jgi:hypothetical protein
MFEYNSDASNVSFSTDIWSLSASMFHLASGQLPFHSSTPALASKNIMNKQQIAPDVRELAPKQIQDTISLQFAAIIAKGLEKNPEKRFKSAIDMAMALHECLVKQWGGVYSVYISYSASDKYYALLLQFLLNCKATDNGRRVFVCIRPFLLGNNERWKGLCQGLLKSLVAVPILSCSMLQSLGQLKGNEEDHFDQTLHELALMHILRAIPNGSLKQIYPLQVESILASEDNKIAVQDLVPRPSPPVVRSIERFMCANDLACSQHSIMQKSVKDSISELLHMQGAQLWKQESEATKQMDPHLEGEAYEMLKMYILPEDLPSQNAVSDLVQKLDPVVKDICKVIDEAHMELDVLSSKSLNIQVTHEDTRNEQFSNSGQIVFAQPS